MLCAFVVRIYDITGFNSFQCSLYTGVIDFDNVRTLISVTVQGYIVFIVDTSSGLVINF